MLDKIADALGLVIREEWAFKNIELTKITNTTDVVTVVDVEYNWKIDHLRLLPAEEMSALVPTGTQAASLLIRPIESETPKVVKAPIKKGDILGKAEVLYGEDVVATVDLIAAESVDRSIILWIFGIFKTRQSKQSESVYKFAKFKIK